MGLVQRDGINRLRHAMRYSREDLTICSMLSGTGWRRRGRGAARRRRPRDGQSRSDRGVGRQPGLDPGQCDDPYRDRAARARREAGRRRPLPHRQRRGRRSASGAAARHRRRARLRGHACAVQGGLCRPRLPGALCRRPGRARSPSGDPRPGLGGGDHRARRRRRSSISPGSTAAPSAAISASATAFRARATARRSFSR